MAKLEFAKAVSKEQIKELNILKDEAKMLECSLTETLVITKQINLNYTF
jgi:hypothetical protein